jgi:5-methylcytosine-specific restriction endonuclease McrA
MQFDGMSKLEKIVAAHPLPDLPYSKIKFSHFDGQRKPIYVVGDTKAGAKTALAKAFELFGGNCFHCGKKHKPSKLSQAVNRDHIRPTSKGGTDFLHNLVISCGPCNTNKKDKELSRCRKDATERYLKALDAHLINCLKNLALTPQPS